MEITPTKATKLIADNEAVIERLQTKMKLPATKWTEANAMRSQITNRVTIIAALKKVAGQ